MACDDQYEPGISKYHNNVYKVVSTGVLSNKNSPQALLWIGHWGLIQPYGTPSGNVVMEIVYTVYPKKYAHGFVVLCFVVVMQSFIMNSHEVFIHIHQGCFAGTGAIVRLPQCQWSKPDGYGKISQCITTTKHSKAKTVCIFLGIYCTLLICRMVWILLVIFFH